MFPEGQWSCHCLLLQSLAALGLAEATAHAQLQVRADPAQAGVGRAAGGLTYQPACTAFDEVCDGYTRRE